MSNIPLSPSTAFASSSYDPTPFGYFDDDPFFKSDADAMVTYVRRKLGGATVTTEITEVDIFTCFEDATFEFQSYVNMYQARDLMMDLIGTPSASIIILPGVTGATKASGAPLPLPILTSAGFFVKGLSGKILIHILPPLLT